MQRIPPMIELLRADAPYAWQDVLDDAMRRGRNGWSRPIERSLAMLGLDA